MWAKIKSHPIWPGKVVEETKSGEFKCKFYNNHLFGICLTKNLYDFEEFYTSIVKQDLKAFSKKEIAKAIEDATNEKEGKCVPAGRVNVIKEAQMIWAPEKREKKLEPKEEKVRKVKRGALK